MSSLSVSPRKKARNRTAQAIISGTPSASIPMPITKTLPNGPKTVKPFSGRGFDRADHEDDDHPEAAEQRNQAAHEEVAGAGEESPAEVPRR